MRHAYLRLPLRQSSNLFLTIDISVPCLLNNLGVREYYVNLKGQRHLEQYREGIRSTAQKWQESTGQ